MKPEPLKDKLRTMAKGRRRGRLKYFAKDNVKSAVEWLKEWTNDNLSDGQKKYTLEAIDKAFEDVTKK